MQLSALEAQITFLFIEFFPVRVRGLNAIPEEYQVRGWLTPPDDKPFNLRNAGYDVVVWINQNGTLLCHPLVPGVTTDVGVVARAWKGWWCDANR